MTQDWKVRLNNCLFETVWRRPGFVAFLFVSVPKTKESYSSDQNGIEDSENGGLKPSPFWTIVLLSPRYVQVGSKSPTPSSSK